MPSAGTVLGGRYRLERSLGAGAMGSVWAAVHLELEAPVAIKLEHPSAEAPRRTHASRREARAAARLRSPHVVQIFDFGTDDGVAFIAMELLVGESLRARLNSEVRLSPTQASEIVRQAASGLDVAHVARIVHRDIKPSNLFLAEEDGREIVKVLDFGVAKWLDADPAAQSRTEANRVVGSAAYMSPEQARGQAIDHRSDIWALSVVAYEMLLGERPFPGSNIPETLGRICAGIYSSPSSRAGDDWAELDRVFARGLHLDPAKRFQSAGEFGEAFAAAVRRLSSPETRLVTAADNHVGDAFGRAGETASLRVAATSSDGEARTRLNTVVGLLLGTALLGGGALYQRWSNASKAAPPSAVRQVDTAPRVSAGSATIPPRASIRDIPKIAAAPAPVAAPRPPGSARRAASPSAPRRLRAEATIRTEAAAVPRAAASRIDPVFGLEVPAP